MAARGAQTIAGSIRARRLACRSAGLCRGRATRLQAGCAIAAGITASDRKLPENIQSILVRQTEQPRNGAPRIRSRSSVTHRLASRQRCAGQLCGATGTGQRRRNSCISAIRLAGSGQCARRASNQCHSVSTLDRDGRGLQPDHALRRYRKLGPRDYCAVTDDSWPLRSLDHRAYSSALSGPVSSSSSNQKRNQSRLRS